MKLKISIPIGDAFDKLSILEIKQLHAEDAKQISNILNEVDSFSSELESLWEGGGERLASIYKKLKATNLELWGIEDSIRLKEKDRLFDEEFIQLARDVYYTNDRRCREKNEINDICGSDFHEEKIYQSYE